MEKDLTRLSARAPSPSVERAAAGRARGRAACTHLRFHADLRRLLVGFLQDEFAHLRDLPVRTTSLTHREDFPSEEGGQSFMKDAPLFLSVP